MKKKQFEIKKKLREFFSKQFLALRDTDSVSIRKKQLKLCLLIVFGVGIFVIMWGVKGGSTRKAKNKANNPQEVARNIAIKDLTKGVDNETLWTETGQKSINEMRANQKSTSEEMKHMKDALNKDKVSHVELKQYLESLEAKLRKEYEGKLAKQIEILQANPESTHSQESAIDVSDFRTKKKIYKKIGEYVPAGSYVQGKMISGVDAGVGIAAASDPRQVLIRITDKVISAGFGKRYLSSKALVGCVVQCQAVGDISSEKVYLKPVLLTCARSANTVVELPVKGYVTSKGKAGIRGEVISREGDLVAKSFLSGLIGGFGSGVSQYAQGGGLSFNGGVLTSERKTSKDIVTQGFGSGLSNSTGKLSDYLMKRAEQYQPVISIDEGVQVTIIFQEGFSLSEEEE